MLMHSLRLQVVVEFSVEQRQALLKFVTSCSRAPLGGFQHLVPPLCIHKVRVRARCGPCIFLSRRIQAAASP